MTNPYYTATGTPPTGALGASSSIRSEFAAIATAFDRLATFTANAGKLVVINAGASGETASTFTINGVTQMFDPAYVTDYTGIATGAKRLNSATGLFETYNGSSWVALVLSYLPLIGGALTGPVTSSSTWNGQTISSAASLTGTLAVAGAINGQTISSAASFTGTVAVAGVLTATGGIAATGGVTGALTGNASTATKLQTARLINGTSFDGTADITVSVTNISGNAATATRLQTARAINGTSFDGSADITISVTNISGNAGTATRLQTARLINGTSFDGSADITVSVTNISGNAGTATTASNVINNSGRTDATAYPVLWSPAGGGGGQPTFSCAAITITASTGLLSASSLYASGEVTAFSDARVKTDVVTIANALAMVEALRGVTYTRTDEEHQGLRQAGVIAQEVQAVMPEVVRERDDGMLTVAYGNMVSVLIEAVKELSAKVKVLEHAQ